MGATGCARIGERPQCIVAVTASQHPKGVLTKAGRGTRPLEPVRGRPRVAALDATKPSRAWVRISTRIDKKTPLVPRQALRRRRSAIRPELRIRVQHVRKPPPAVRRHRLDASEPRRPPRHAQAARPRTQAQQPRRDAVPDRARDGAIPRGHHHPARPPSVARRPLGAREPGRRMGLRAPTSGRRSRNPASVSARRSGGSSCCGKNSAHRVVTGRRCGGGGSRTAGLVGASFARSPPVAACGVTRAPVLRYGRVWELLDLMPIETVAYAVAEVRRMEPPNDQTCQFGSCHRTRRDEAGNERVLAGSDVVLVVRNRIAATGASMDLLHAIESTPVATSWPRRRETGSCSHAPPNIRTPSFSAWLSAIVGPRRRVS
jgi:hypothetical protein